MNLHSLGCLVRHWPRFYKGSQLQLVSKRIVQGWNIRSASQSSRLYKEQKDPSNNTPTLPDHADQQYRKSEHANPIQRTVNVLADDVKQYFGVQTNRPQPNRDQASSSPTSGSITDKVWPSDCDVLVVGGGVMGSSIAYHLKERALQGLRVVMVEEDSTVSMELKTVVLTDIQ